VSSVSGDIFFPDNLLYGIKPIQKKVETTFNKPKHCYTESSFSANSKDKKATKSSIVTMEIRETNLK